MIDYCDKLSYTNFINILGGVVMDFLRKSKMSTRTCAFCKSKITDTGFKIDNIETPICNSCDIKLLHAYTIESMEHWGSARVFSHASLRFILENAYPKEVVAPLFRKNK